MHRIFRKSLSKKDRPSVPCSRTQDQRGFLQVKLNLPGIRAGKGVQRRESRNEELRHEAWST
eukprot:6455725-Amphidinium_carterae.1